MPLPSQPAAPLSAVANAAILSGFVGVLAYESRHFSVAATYAAVPWFNWGKFPIFFSVRSTWHCLLPR